MSAFEKYGGFSAISKMVMAFYDAVLDDDQIGPFFEDTDMPRLVDHQTKFIATVMGGPASYSDEALRRVHQPLEIGADDFGRMATILRETLQDFGVETNDIDHVMNEINRRAHSIIAPAPDKTG